MITNDKAYYFQVVHKTLGKVMVLKRNKHRANRNAMLKEIQLLNTLSHENILRYAFQRIAQLFKAQVFYFR